MTSLPPQFVASITELQNYSKSSLRIVPISGQSPVRGGGYIKFALPMGTVLDMRTFALFFDGKTLINDLAVPNTHLVGFPKFVGPSLIDTLEIYVNGRSVQNIPRYGRIYALLQDFKNNYNSQIKKLGTNADPSVITTMADTGVITRYNTYQSTGNVDANAFKGKYVINDWIGFLNCEPSILDTNVLGQVEIHCKLNTGNVLFTPGTPNAADTVNFELTNIVAYVDQIHFKSDRYYSLVKSLLEQEGGFQIVYKNWMYYDGAPVTTSKTNTVKITENCSSLDRILYTFYNNTAEAIAGKQPLKLGTATRIANFDGADAAAVNAQLNARVQGGHIPPSRYNFTNLLASGDDQLTNNSIFFHRNGLGVGTVQFEINSQDMTNPLSLSEQWQQTLQAFDLHNDDAIQINPAIRNLDVYERDFYCCAYSTSHIGNKDKNTIYISGRDTMASAMNISVKAVAGRGWDAAQAAVPVIITEMTSMLRVVGNRQVMPIR